LRATFSCSGGLRYLSFPRFTSSSILTSKLVRSYLQTIGRLLGPNGCLGLFRRAESTLECHLPAAFGCTDLVRCGLDYPVPTHHISSTQRLGHVVHRPPGHQPGLPRLQSISKHHSHLATMEKLPNCPNRTIQLLHDDWRSRVRDLPRENSSQQPSPKNLHPPRTPGSSTLSRNHSSSLRLSQRLYLKVRSRR
jgi:hypothetical protein